MGRPMAEPGRNNMELTSGEELLLDIAEKLKEEFVVAATELDAQFHSTRYV